MDPKSSSDIFVQDAFSKQPNFFNLSDSLLKTLLSSPAIEEFFQDRLKKEIEKIQLELTSKIKSEVEQSVQKEMLEKIDQGVQAQLKSIQSDFEQLSQKLLQEREELLKARSQGWLESMVKILKSFMVYRGIPDSECLRTWLEETLKLFPEQKRVQVYVSSTTFEKLKNTAGEHFQILLDERLQPTQVRFECNEGGAVFDSNEQLQRLERMIQT